MGDTLAVDGRGRNESMSMKEQRLVAECEVCDKVGSMNMVHHKDPQWHDWNAGRRK